MIGKFIAERKAQTHRPFVRINHIDARNFRFLPAIRRKAGAVQRGAGGNEDRAIAFVKPFGLLADGPGHGLATCLPFQKHAHRIRRSTCGGGLVHLVASLGRTKVRQPRTADEQMRGVFMVDRREQGNTRQIERITAPCCGKAGERCTLRQRVMRQRQSGSGIVKLISLALSIKRRNAARPILFELDQRAHHALSRLPSIRRGSFQGLEACTGGGSSGSGMS